MYLAVYLYILALALQCAGAIISWMTWHKAKQFGYGWLFLAVGLTMMISRRITPILFIRKTSTYSISDALLAFSISLILLLGVIGIRKIVNLLNEQKNALLQISQTDDLTGALNRNETFQRIILEIERSFRTDQSIAFMVLDIDHFKHVNDTFGHEIGDEVLKGIAACCHSSIREIDIFGRIGGEEFLLVLPNINQDDALQFSERLRANIEEHEELSDLSAPINVTMSIGIAIFDPCKESREEDPKLILRRKVKKADDAMYQAKHAGRNKVKIAEN